VESREPPGTLHPSSWSQVVHLQLALPVNLESLSEVLRFFFEVVLVFVLVVCYQGRPHPRRCGVGTLALQFEVW